MPEVQRLDKFISSQRSDLSRSMVKELVRKGKVTVNNTAAKSPDMKVFPDTDIVEVEGALVSYKKHIYIMLNKPQGVVCSTRDGLSPTVLSLIPENLRRKGLFPAGRLDKDTEGFVLITDDGALAHKILSPKNHVPKTYFVRLAKECNTSYKEQFSNGIILSDGTKCLPAQFSPLSAPNECEVVLHEGMFHQVKRMFEALGNKVVYLKRIKIGNLFLDENLPLGGCVEIIDKNINKLFSNLV